MFCERCERGWHAKTINYTTTKNFLAKNAKAEHLKQIRQNGNRLSARLNYGFYLFEFIPDGACGRLIFSDFWTSDPKPNLLWWSATYLPIYFHNSHVHRWHSTEAFLIRRWGRIKRRVALELCSKCNSSDVLYESLCSPWISKAFWMCTACHWRFRSGRDNRDYPCASQQPTHQHLVSWKRNEHSELGGLFIDRARRTRSQGGDTSKIPFRTMDGKTFASVAITYLEMIILHIEWAMGARPAFGLIYIFWASLMFVCGCAPLATCAPNCPGKTAHVTTH